VKGVKGEMESRKRKCSNCGKEAEKMKRCSSCGEAFYCDQQCQQQHWKEHKLICQKITATDDNKEVKKDSTKNFKIQIASDIHLEMFGSARWDWKDTITPSAPNLALLGDIGCPGNEGSDGIEIYKNFLLYQAERFENVYVLGGNHEYYIHRLPQGKEPMTVPEVDTTIDGICKLRDNLHYLNNRSVVKDGVRIVGSLLWSQVPLSMERKVSMSMNDYWRSYMPNDNADILKYCNAQPSKTSKTRLLTVKDTVQWHNTNVQFIENEIEIATRNKEKCLVLTHHAPHVKGTSHPRFNNSEFNCAFSTNLTNLMDGTNKKYNSLSTWAFGHTHYTSDFKVGNVRIVSNQHGYVSDKDNQVFDSSFVIEV